MTDLHAPRLLVVDNDREVSMLVGVFLERSGNSVTVATNGREGLERIEAAGDAFDLVLLDLRMPELSGIEFLDRLEAMPSPPPVLVLSGYIAPVDRERLDASPLVRGTLEKPFDLEKLASVIADTVAPARPEPHEAPHPGLWNSSEGD